MGLLGDCFDAVLCSLGMMSFPDPVDYLQQMYRISKPGGNTAVAVWGERGTCGWSGSFPLVDTGSIARFVRCSSDWGRARL